MANEEGTSGASAFRPEITRRRPDFPGGPLRDIQSVAGNESGNKLIVGRDIVLNGQIMSCDQLVVEGQVEAELENSQSIEILETGFFKGSAIIEEATISGKFEGELTVRGELTIRSTGRIEGEIRYSKLCIESGGQIVGTVAVLAPSNVASVTPVVTAGEEN